MCRFNIMQHKVHKDFSVRPVKVINAICFFTELLSEAFITKSHVLSVQLVFVK